MPWKHFKRLDNMKKTEYTGYVYDFSVDYEPITVDDIKDIHKYLMKKMIFYEYIKRNKKMFLYMIMFIKQKIINYIKWV